jgi:hypothetical protein
VSWVLLSFVIPEVFLFRAERITFGTDQEEDFFFLRLLLETVLLRGTTGACLHGSICIHYRKGFMQTASLFCLAFMHGKCDLDDETTGIKKCFINTDEARF